MLDKIVTKRIEGIFGKDKVKYYQREIRKALNCEGKYKDAHGLIHSGIVLHIQVAEEVEFLSKAFIGVVLDGFISEQGEIDIGNILITADPCMVLKYAKKYIDDFDELLKR